MIAVRWLSVGLAWAALPHGLLAGPTAGPFAWKDVPVFTSEFSRTSGLTRIPLHVDTGKLDYPQGFPVSGGVPLPRGELTSIAHARVFSPSNRGISSQLRPLAFWPDMSIKWLLVEFRLQGKATCPVYHLEYGAEVEATVVDAPITVVDSVDRLVIDTGTLKAEIGKGTGSLIDQLWLDRDGDGAYRVEEVVLTSPVDSYVHLRDPFGDRSGFYSTLADTESDVRIEKSGSEEVTVLVKAWHRDGKGRQSCPVDARLTFYRGRNDVRIYHTFHVSEDGNTITFPSFGLRIPVGAASRIAAGVDHSPVLAAGDRFELYQDSRESYWYPKMDQFDPYCRGRVDGRDVFEGDRCDGWVQLRQNDRSLTVSLVEAWQNFPKAFTFADGVLRVELWPYAKDEPMCFRRFDQSLPPHYTIFQEGESRHLRGFEYELRCYRNRTEDWERFSGTGFGLAKSHDITLSFGSTDADGAQAAELAFRPLLPFVSGAWNSFTGVSGNFHPEDRVNFPAFETSWDRRVEALRKLQTEWFNWYGMWHWGDFQSHYKGAGDRWGERRWTNFDSKYGWRNGGMAIPFGFTMRYLRSGRRDAWEMARQVTVKHMDVSSSHPRAWEEGRLVSPEQMADTQFPWVGGGIRYNSDGWGTVGYGYDSQHTWLIGVAQHFYLTGNFRARDVIEEYIEAVDKGCKFLNIKRRSGRFYPTHARTVDMTSTVAAIGYELDPRSERNREIFDYMVWHQTKGMASLKADEKGVCYHSDINAAIGWYYTLYKGINIMYMLAVDPRPELVEAVLAGHPESFMLTPPAGGAFHALCYQYGRNRNFAKMAARCLRYGGLATGTELRMEDALPPFDYGYSLLENYYTQRAAYDARLHTHPTALSNSARIGYATGARGPDNDPVGDTVRFVPIDLRSLVNADPFGGAAPVVANEDFSAGPVRLDFGPRGRLEPGWLPSDKRCYYPSTKAHRDPDTTFSTLPFGSTVQMRGIDFSLPNPRRNGGRALLIVRKATHIPIGLKARQLYILTGPADTRDIYHREPGVTYTVRFSDGTAVSGELENMTHYQSRYLQPRLTSEALYGGSPSSYHLSVVPIDCPRTDVVGLELRPVEGAQIGLNVFAVTAAVADPRPRTWRMRDLNLGTSGATFSRDAAVVGTTRCSDQRIDYRRDVPNGEFMLQFTASSSLTGCPMAVYVNGVEAFTRSALAARTTYQVPVRITGGTLQLTLIPGELHTKAVNGVATVTLHDVSLADIPNSAFVPVLEPGAGAAKRPLIYGWRLRGERAILRHCDMLDLKPMADTYHPAANRVEDDSVYMITGGTMRGEFIVDDVPPGMYRVTVWMNTHGISSKVDLRIEGDVLENQALPSAQNNPKPYNTTAGIDHPFAATVQITDGQLNVVIDTSREQGHYVLGTWHVAGLEIARRESVETQ